MKPREVRSPASRASDPLAMVVGGLVLTLASVRLFSALGLSADEVAALHAGLLMLFAGIRLVLESKNARKVSIVAEQHEDGAFRRGLLTDPPLLVRRGLGEGGRLIKDDEGDDDLDAVAFAELEAEQRCSTSGQVQTEIGPDDVTPRYHPPEGETEAEKSKPHRVRRRG